MQWSPIVNTESKGDHPAIQPIHWIASCFWSRNSPWAWKAQKVSPHLPSPVWTSSAIHTPPASLTYLYIYNKHWNTLSTTTKHIIEVNMSSVQLTRFNKKVSVYDNILKINLSFLLKFSHLLRSINKVPKTSITR